MAPNFDPWLRQWQNGLHTVGRSYSTPDKFHPNISPETEHLKASHKGSYTAKELL